MVLENLSPTFSPLSTQGDKFTVDILKARVENTPASVLILRPIVIVASFSPQLKGSLNLLPSTSSLSHKTVNIRRQRALSKPRVSTRHRAAFRNRARSFIPLFQIAWT